MHALGISTTRSLAMTATGQPVYREELLKGAVLTRVAASRIRVGTSSERQRTDVAARGANRECKKG
jgi:uncharacterized protein YdiU (UPF0061 family)